MPLIRLECGCGYHEDAYVVQITSPTPHRQCHACGDVLSKGLSVGRGLTYFSEKSPQRIMNLDRGQTAITSPRQHMDLCKANNVEPALNWHTGKK